MSNIVSVYSYLCSLYLPSPPLCMTRAGVLHPSDVCVRKSTHATHSWKPCYRSVFFFFSQCHLLCAQRVWRTLKKKKEKNASFCTRHIRRSLPWNIIQSDGETLQFNVCQASIAVLSTAVSLNGLLLSVLLWHCVDFVLWNKCPFSFCMFFTMLKVAAVGYYTVDVKFSSVNHHFSADSYSGSLY